MRHTGKRHFRILSALAAAASALTFPVDARACRIHVPPVLEDVRYAEVVVVGRISKYRIVRDEAFRRQMLASPRLSPDMRRYYEDPEGSLLTDYARFDVHVDEVLVGRPPRRLSVTWNNSTYGEPKQMAAGPYLIALRSPVSAGPPLRGPSVAIFASPDPTVPTLLQAPCSRAFIYEAQSEQAGAIRRILNARPR
jgi:hypothetical protein